MLSCFIHCRRLVARTLPFQGGEAGSIPVDSTKICRGGRLVMQRIVYPSYAGSIPVLGAKFYKGNPMANVKKGNLTAPPQWWKHLKDWKRVFWKSERQAQKRNINKGE